MIEVIAAGPLTSVQTAIGRTGWRRLGVPVGGAADAWSARLANRLVGNEDDAAVLEVTLGGAAIGFSAATTVSVTGGLVPVVDAVPAAGDAAWRARAGTILRVDPGAGLRGYVAVGGGIDVEPVLGSAATDVRSGFGGHEGRPLRDGDRLRTRIGSGGTWRWTGRRSDGPIRLVSGPHGTAEELSGEWTVAAEADRTGVRVTGAAVEGSEIPSMGLALGAVQVPPDGRPIVMLADRPVTGGYRVPACVVGADVGRVAQARPGDRLRFASVSMEEAREAWRHAENELAALEALDAPEDDELAWIGSHG